MAELHAINPDIDPVAQFDEAFAAFRVGAQVRAPGQTGGMMI